MDVTNVRSIVEGEARRVCSDSRRERRADMVREVVFVVGMWFCCFEMWRSPNGSHDCFGGAPLKISCLQMSIPSRGVEPAKLWGMKHEVQQLCASQSQYPA